MFIVSILIAIVASTSYHILQKSTPQAVNPIIVILTIYLTGIVVAVPLFLFFPLETSIAESVKQLNWSSIGLGVVVVGIEIGFLLMYRAGWNISVGALVVNIAATLILIPVGLLFYREQLTPLNLLGIVICIIGLVMINIKPS
ncbi:MAG: EamA family transporter [Anaerolineae bacterium]